MIRKTRRSLRPTNALPLAKAEGNVMLVAIIAVLVFLASLSWIVGTAANKMAGRWNQALANELTIEIDTTPAANAQNAAPELRAQRVKELLSQYSAITAIDTIDRDQLQKMLAPWLGDMSSYSDLPLPVLLHVSLRPGHDLNFDTIAKQIMKSVPGVNVVAHYAWAGEVQDMARVVTLIAWSVMILIAVISVFQMVFMARSRLAMFAPEIEILHTLGASDGFIAAEFERQAFVLSLIGAMLGTIALLLVVGFVLHTIYPGLQLMAGIPIGQLSQLEEWHREIWGALLVPVVILFLNSFMCRAAVLSALRRLV